MVVVTAARKPVLLVQPESADALSALIAQSDDPLVQGTVSGWTALAETQAELDAYRAALGRGTLDGVESFSDAMTELPEEALVRGWVDFAALARDLASAFEQSGVQGELGVDWLAAALTAEDDGVHFSVGVRTPGGNGSSYEPELFERVPADAVAALSFGGTQGTLDRIEGAVGRRRGLVGPRGRGRRLARRAARGALRRGPALRPRGRGGAAGGDPRARATRSREDLRHRRPRRAHARQGGRRGGSDAHRRRADPARADRRGHLPDVCAAWTTP